MRLPRILRLTGAWLALAMALGPIAGCVDPQDAGGGSTSGTALYAFDTADSATTRLLIWDDLSAFFDAASLPATTRTLSSDQFSKVKNLSWGGLALDPNGNRLWLVGEGGDVVRIERIRQQAGSIPTTEAVHFTLGTSSDRLSGGKFGQAACDPSNGTLYVMESSDTEARLWTLVSPLQYTEGATVSPGTKASVSGDKQGGGVAAGGGSFYAFFANGNQVQYLNETLNDARIRQGQGSSFQQVLIGPATGLAKYGSLAFDSGNNRLYAARHNLDSLGTGAPIQVFVPGQFGGYPNRAPDKGSLGDGTLDSIRVLAHPGTKDWLGILDSLSSDTPTNLLHLYRGPSSGNGTLRTFNLGGSVKLKGLALDGSA